MSRNSYREKPEAAGRASAPSRAPMLVILLLVFAVNYMDRQLLAILIEPIKRDIGMSDTAAGLLYGFTFAVFYSFVGIPIARLADRSNRSRIITGSLMLFSVMTALCGWASTYWQLLLARIGVGIGEAGTGPPSHSLIADLYPIERRSTAMAIFAVGPHLGILFGFLFGGFLGQFLGWRPVFLIAGVAGLLMAVLAVYVLKEPARTVIVRVPEQSQRTAGVNALRTLWRSASMRHVFIGGTAANIAVAALVAWLPAFLMRSHGLSLSMTGAVLAFVLGVLGGCGTWLGGTLADRLGARDPAWRLRCSVVALLIAAPCWMAVVAVGNTLAALAALMIGGALIAFHIGPTFAMVQSLAPSNTRAFAASLLLFTGNLVGVGLGPLAVGLLSDAWFEEHGANSLRIGLMITPPLFIWASIHYEAAARTIAADLRSASLATEPTVAAPATTAGAHFR